MRTAAEAEHANRRLRARHGRATRYERVLEVDGERYHAGYSAHRNKGDLIESVAPMPDGMIKRGGITDSTPADYSRRDGWTIGRVRIFYGRTEREALMEGELPRYTPEPGNNTLPDRE